MTKNDNEINGTAEIQKLYKYAGFTPGPGAHGILQKQNLRNG